MDGWHLKTAFHDPMHVVFLGTVRDLYASSMGFWMRNQFFGEGTLVNKLNQFSRDLRTASRNQKILADVFKYLLIWCKKKLYKAPSLSQGSFSGLFG